MYKDVPLTRFYNTGKQQKDGFPVKWVLVHIVSLSGSSCGAFGELRLTFELCLIFFFLYKVGI